MPFRFVEEETEDLNSNEQQKFRFVEEEKPLGSQLTREAGQYSMRGLENILSAPREFAEFGQRLVPKKALIKGAEYLGLGKGAEKLLELSERFAPYKLLPERERLRDTSKSAFKEVYEPQSEREELFGDIIGEAIEMAFPIGGKIPKGKAFLTSMGANLAKETAKELGFSPEVQELTKLGGYGVFALTHPNASKNFYKRKYKEASELLPKDAGVNFKNINNKLFKIEKELEKGGKSVAGTEKAAMTWIDNLRERAKKGILPIEEIVEAKKKINTDRTSLKKNVELGKRGAKVAQANLEKVTEVMDDALRQYGKQNPEWWKTYKEATSAFAATERSKKAASVLAKVIPSAAVTHAGLAGLLGHLGGGLETAALGVGTAVPAYLVTRTVNRIMRSPPLRKEFFKMYEAAARGEASVAEKSLKKLDKALSYEKEDEKD